ncbi:MAG: hypothetical protein ACI97N_002352 [Cognaticolwellia sp.]|jgi:hypothetical protein
MKTGMKILAVCTLILGQLFATESVKAQMGSLELASVSEFTHVYSDRGTGSNMDLSIWAPVLPSGYFALGHLAKNGYEAPNTSMTVVKGLVKGAIAYPTGYTLVWKDEGSGGNQDGAFWEPIAPAGYSALGTVVTASWSQPPLTAVVCLRNDLLWAENISDLIWNDKGSGASSDLSLWNLQASSATLISSGSFFSYASYIKPSNSAVSYSIMVVDVLQVNSFNHVYSDKGTGSDVDLSTWSPVVPEGFLAVGHLAKNGYDAPTSSIMVVQSLVKGAVAYPTGYRLVWKDTGSGGNQDGAFWEPIPPAGYVAMGTVVTASYTQPPLTAVVCILSDLTARINIGNLIWNDKGSGADRDLSLWTMQSSDYFNSGSFLGYGSHSKPASSKIAYGIKMD